MITKKDIGRRVIVYHEDEFLTGRICQVIEKGAPVNIGIEFDEPRYYFHDCGETCIDGFGWYVSEKDITLD